jgi:hypothetical protein
LRFIRVLRSRFIFSALSPFALATGCVHRSISAGARREMHPRGE